MVADVVINLTGPTCVGKTCFVEKFLAYIKQRNCIYSSYYMNLRDNNHEIINIIEFSLKLKKELYNSDIFSKSEGEQ